MSPLAGGLQVLRDDRGTVSVIAYVIAFPALMALLVLALQAALLYTARETALTAAEQGLAAARAVGSTHGQGAAAACEFAAATRGLLRSPACDAAGGATVTVTVCGNAADLLPGFPVRVCRQAQGARELFTTRTAP